MLMFLFSSDRWLDVGSLGQFLETQNNIGTHLGEPDILINLGINNSNYLWVGGE